MPFNVNTSCTANVTLAGPSTSQASTVTVFQLPEHPATGVMRCVADSTGKFGQLTFEGTSVLIDLPQQSNLHLVTKPSSQDTDWQPRKQILPTHWAIPFSGQIGSNGTSVTLTNQDTGDTGFWLKGMPASGGTNDIVTVEVVGSAVSFDSASASQSGTFSGAFTVIDTSGPTSFGAKWSSIGQACFQGDSPLIGSSMPLTVALSAAGTGLDCHVVPSLAITNVNTVVSGVMRVTTSATLPGSLPTVSEGATPTS